MEQLLLETLSRDMNDRKNMKSKQHGFTNGKSCSTNLINFSNEVTSLVDKERAVGIVYRDLRKAFDTHLP